jgi:hypothetical protein
MTVPLASTEAGSATYLGKVWKKIILWATNQVLNAVKPAGHGVVIACHAHDHGRIYVHRVCGILQCHRRIAAKHHLKAANVTFGTI